MARNKMVLLRTWTLCAVLLSFSGSSLADNSPPRLVQVVYLTTSKACGCTLERCQAADAVIAQVFVGVRESLLRRLDYATDKNTARDYIRKYRLTTIPALLFLDAQGNLLWSAPGELRQEDLINQLTRFGS